MNKQMDEAYSHEVAGHLVRGLSPCNALPQDKAEACQETSRKCSSISLCETLLAVCSCPTSPVYHLVQPRISGAGVRSLGKGHLSMLLLDLTCRSSGRYRRGWSYLHLGSGFFEHLFSGSPFTAFSSASACSLAIHERFWASCTSSSDNVDPSIPDARIRSAAHGRYRVLPSLRPI